MPRRDPLSVHYDGVVHGMLLRAARASSTSRGVLVYIASPRAEFRHPDRSGRTVHERAFTRSAYYIVKGGPNHSGDRSYGNVPDWSLKLTWGEELRASSRGRLARPVVIRLFPRSQARVHGPKWKDGFNRSEGSRE